MPTEPRVHITFRIATKGFDWVTDMANRLGVGKSVVLRHALAVAKKYEGEVIARIKDET